MSTSNTRNKCLKDWRPDRNKKEESSYGWWVIAIILVIIIIIVCVCIWYYFYYDNGSKKEEGMIESMKNKNNLVEAGCGETFIDLNTYREVSKNMNLSKNSSSRTVAGFGSSGPYLYINDFVPSSSSISGGSSTG